MYSSVISAPDAQQVILHNPNAVVLFTTMQKPPTAKPAIIAQLAAPVYIPHSLMFDFQHTIVDKSSVLSNTMPSAAQFQQQVRELGIDQDSEILVYDDFGNFCASRVWFMFKTMSFDNIKLIDGGLPQWLKLGLPQTSVLQQAKSHGNFTAVSNSKMRFVDEQHVLLNTVHARHANVADARSPGRFSGAEAEPRAGMRSGHIPNACNIHYASLQQSGCYKDKPSLQSAFTALDKQAPVVFSCGSGVTACILAQAAFELGYDDISVYDGSWSQWGASDELPLETSHAF